MARLIEIDIHSALSHDILRGTLTTREIASRNRVDVRYVREYRYAINAQLGLPVGALIKLDGWGTPTGVDDRHLIPPMSEARLQSHLSGIATRMRMRAAVATHWAGVREERNG